MDAATQRIANGLQQAMRAEHEGHHFYKMAAQTTQDPKGRDTFTTLADEEREHFEFLKRQHESIVGTGRVDSQAKLGVPHALAGDHPIFSPEIRRRISGAHYEMTALAIGVQLELSSVNFYRTEAQAAGIPEVRSFYEQLAVWEQGHLNALQKQADALREEYWAAAKFAPF